MDDSEAMSLEQIRAFLQGTGEVRFKGQRREESDYIDAEAIAEAVQRPTMRFVPIKTKSSWICRLYTG